LSFGLQTLPFGENKLASSVKRLRSFDGKLYALDPSTQQITRYEPQGNGYPAAPASYFGQALPDLAKATDMATDGNIYVALSDGRLLKFNKGLPESFEIRGLGEPLREPTIVAIDQNVPDSSVYVFDAGLKRIVQFRPDGLFVRQFRADGSTFDGLQDILVDEQNNRLYVINQGVLYAVTLPPLR
jgi:DNA-binding beta-propeller fold protein YncE